MRRIILLQCAVMTALLAACGSRIAPRDAEGGIVLKPLEQTQKVDDISTWVDAVEFVRIADDERTLFSTVVKMLLDDNGNIFLLDDQGRIVALKPDGTFLRTVARQGRANNEYISVSDIAVAGPEFMILDGSKVKCFDLSDPSGVRSIDIPVSVPCDALAPDGDGGVYLFSAFSLDPAENRSDADSLLYRVSAEGDLVGSYLRRTDCTLSLNNISQSSCGEYMLRPQDGNHIFYRLTADGIVPAYRVDFGDENIPYRYYFDVAGEDLMSYIMSPYYKMPMELHETASHLFFRVAGPEAREVSVVYDREGSVGIMWENAPSDMQMQILGSDGKWFYAIMPETGGADDGMHGPLYGYVQKALSEKEPDAADHSYIVKIRFRKM